jgi:exopolysaccharide production protein ExoZ
VLQLTIETNRLDIVSIQMLRGIAASMVVFVHLEVQLKRLGYGSFDATWLGTGVDIFFVISGFIMWVSVERRPRMTPGEFFRNRIIRVVPLYWLVSAGVLSITFAAPQLLQTTVFSAPHALASFLFLPARHPVTGQFWPLLVPGWTLNYEMLFYLLFAAAIAGSGGSSRIRLVIVAALIAAVVLLGSALEGRIDVMHFYANPILFEFIAGITIGIVYVQRRVPSSFAWFAALAAGFFFLWFGQRFGVFTPITNLLGAAMVVSGALFSPNLWVPGLKALGDASYSLYLTHVVTLSAWGQMWATGLQSLPAPLFVISALIACVAGALLCFRLVERPLTQGLKKYWVGPTERAPVA